MDHGFHHVSSLKASSSAALLFRIPEQELARKQIVLGGYRLGDFLRLVAQQGVEAPPRQGLRAAYVLTMIRCASLSAR